MSTELDTMMENNLLKSMCKTENFMRNATYIEIANKRKIQDLMIRTAKIVGVMREQTEIMNLKKQNIGDVKVTVRNIIAKQTNITNMDDKV